jgi:multiple sugar transport system permease protein
VNQSTGSDTVKSVSSYETDAAFEARLRKRLSKLILVSMAVLVAGIFSFPMYFMVVSAFKSESEILATPFRWLPEEFVGLSHFEEAFEIAPIAQWYFNSVIVAAIQVGVSIFFGAMAGYGFAKFEFRGKRIFFILILSIMAVPFQILLIPLFVLVRQFGWQDSYAGLIVPGMLSAFGVFMMRQFAYNIPNELLDAARIDGASEFRIFLRIALPLLAPASASLAIILFLFSWNNFLWPLVIVQDRSLLTLPVGMTIFSQPYRGDPIVGPAMAVSALATLPVALLFIFFQRYFIGGMMVSGIKG